MKDLTKEQFAWVEDFMSNSLENCTDEEAFQYLKDEVQLTSEQADWVMSFQHEFLTNPFATLPRKI